MNSYNRQQHMSMLARASRVAGRNGRFRERTHYLTAAELRTVPIARLLRETAWADRPDASDQWRDERRQIVADEFARRGFDTAAADIWPRWEPADYDGHALLQEPRHRGDVQARGCSVSVPWTQLPASQVVPVAQQERVAGLDSHAQAPAGEEPVDPYVVSDANAGAAPMADTQVFEAFHGQAGVERVVDAMVDRSIADPRIAEIFISHDLVRLRRTILGILGQPI